MSTILDINQLNSFHVGLRGKISSKTSHLTLETPDESIKAGAMGLLHYALAEESTFCQYRCLSLLRALYFIQSETFCVAMLPGPVCPLHPPPPHPHPSPPQPSSSSKVETGLWEKSHLLCRHRCCHANVEQLRRRKTGVTLSSILWSLDHHP